VNDARTQRERHAELVDAIDRATTPQGDCSPAQLLTLVAVTAYPTVAGVFYGGNPTDVGSPEVEGGAATYATGPSTVYAINLGTAIPPVGTRVVAHLVGGRMCFRWDG
jgi:hypothetical protein